jgi:TonB family protein
MLISIVIALTIHSLVFVAVQYGIQAQPEELEEYSGPITVTLDIPAEVLDIGRGVDRGQKSDSILEAELPAEVDMPQTETAAETSRSATPEKVQAETRKSIPPETGHPEIVTEKQVAKVQRRDTGVETSEERLQKGGVQEENWEQFDVIGRDSELESGEQKPTIDTVWEESEVKKIGPVFPSPPDQEGEKTLTFNMDQLDAALEEGKEGTEAGGEPEAGFKGGDLQARSEAGIPDIVWDDASRGRRLLSSGGRPVIPEWVKREGLDLIVEVSFSVTPEGHAFLLQVERSSGYTDVDASVLDSVRKLRFNPVREARDVRGLVSYFISTK